MTCDHEGCPEPPTVLHCTLIGDKPHMVQVRAKLCQYHSRSRLKIANLHHQPVESQIWWVAWEEPRCPFQS